MGAFRGAIGFIFVAQHIYWDGLDGASTKHRDSGNRANRYGSAELDYGNLAESVG